MVFTILVFTIFQAYSSIQLLEENKLFIAVPIIIFSISNIYNNVHSID